MDTQFLLSNRHALGYHDKWKGSFIFVRVFFYSSYISLLILFSNRTL